MKKTMNRIEKKNKDLIQDYKNLNQRVFALENKLNKLDQYHRRQNLEINIFPLKPNENEQKLALTVLQKD